MTPMKYYTLLMLLLLAPASTFAAPSSFTAARSTVLASPSLGNAYAAGISIVRTAPVAGDFSAFGGSIISAALVEGDELLLAGSVQLRSRVVGDLRMVAGSMAMNDSVGGDLVAFGLSLSDTGHVEGSVFTVAANTTLAGGATGPVIMYGNNIALAGTFGSDVTLVASGRISLAASTTILGALSYEAPEEAVIPPSVVIRGGVHYTNASYLPDAGTSRTLAIMSIGLFLFIRILGALILAGLLAGLFPRLAHRVIERVLLVRTRTVLLTTLLGFAVVVVTPIVLLLLTLTFVGMGLALALLILYAGIVLLSCIYAGILLGHLLARWYARREHVLWHDGVVGMLLLSLLSLIPYVGIGLVLLVASFSAGALVLIFFQFAFRDDSTPTLV